ncbi:Uncharacterised protein [Serratia liquefaciens]|nr:Uncharacterised protein [Serratia liquefaciens]
MFYFCVIYVLYTYKKQLKISLSLIYKNIFILMGVF